MESVPVSSNGSDHFARLQSADPVLLAEIKAAFYKDTVRAVEGAGGTFADGDVFYRTALVEMLQSGQTVEDSDWGPALETLAIAHYQSWLKERGQTPSEAFQGAAIAVPEEESLRQTRRHVFVWNQLLRISREARLTALAVLGEHWDDVSVAATIGLPVEQFKAKKPQFLGEFRTGLRLSQEELEVWPDWVTGALQDTKGWALWQALHAPEEEEAETAKSKLYRNLFILAMALMLGYIAYNYLVQPKTPEATFKDNFTPPESLMADQQQRYGAELGNDSVSARPNHCELLLRQADSDYKRKHYDEAQDALLLLALDTTGVLCQSDAWFYLGIIRLELNDPQTALECFAKIDNLEKFGEDVYWYQALCFVKLSERNPTLRPKAIRAIQRFMQQTQQAERRAKAEQLLEEMLRE